MNFLIVEEIEIVKMGIYIAHNVTIENMKIRWSLINFHGEHSF